MKEITRVHIAKQAYDIEVGAKKDFEKYMNKLELYAGDAEILADIEIRITELLAEAGVEKGGVITAVEVASVQERLGEPEEFAPEDAPVSEPSLNADETSDGQPQRRLYRDVDGAMLAGVLSGIATYFGANVFWLRLLFIILLIGSAGSVLLVYIVLWLAVPPARTAAEKLQLAGEPVTLASIRKFGEQAQPVVNKSAQIFKEILTIGTGILLVLMGAGAIFATVAAVLAWLFGSTALPPEAGWSLDNVGMSVAWLLCIVAGLLFATLCFVLAYAVFRRRWGKRLTVVTVAIVVAGLVSISTGVGLGMVSYRAEFDAVQKSIKTTSMALPEFKDITAVAIEVDDELAGNVDIQYIVSSDSRWELEALPGVYPQFEVEDEGDWGQIELVLTGRPSWYEHMFMSQPVLKVYGPALEMIRVESGNVNYHNKNAQDHLMIYAQANRFSLTGSYKHVNVAKLTNEDMAEVALSSAAIENLNIDATNSYVHAGVVRTLVITQSDACAVDGGGGQSRVRVQAVSSGMLTLNNAELPAQTIRRECGTIVIGKSDDVDTPEY